MRIERSLRWCTLLSVIGIGLSSFLIYLHLGHLRGELLGGAICGSGALFNCHAVTGGAWSSFLGMPLAFWGLLSYLFIAAISLWAAEFRESSSEALTIIFCLTGFAVLVDIFLLSVMVFVIRFGCLFCLLTYVVNLLLLIVGERGLDYPWYKALGRLPSALGRLMPGPGRSTPWLLWGIILSSAVGTIGLHKATLFASHGGVGDMRGQIKTFLSRQSPAIVDTSNDPRRGSLDAPIQLIEFSDLLCPACHKASKINTIFLANHRGEVSLIFKNYPLDPTCNETVARMVHPGACILAAASECAHKQGKFWEFHDMVFKGKDTYKTSYLMNDLGSIGVNREAFDQCMNLGLGMKAVKADIAEAKLLKVSSTPTYVVNGYKFSGGLTVSILEQIVEVVRDLSGF